MGASTKSNFPTMRSAYARAGVRLGGGGRAVVKV